VIQQDIMKGREEFKVTLKKANLMAFWLKEKREAVDKSVQNSVFLNNF